MHVKKQYLTDFTFQQVQDAVATDYQDLLRKKYSAKQCEYVSIAAMEQKCNIGQKFVMKRVRQPVLYLSNSCRLLSMVNHLGPFSEA